MVVLAALSLVAPTAAGAPWSPLGLARSSGTAAPADLSVLATVGVGGEPELAAYNTTGGDVYVASEASGTVSVLSGTASVASTNVSAYGTGPYDPVYDPARPALVLTYHGALPHNVSVLYGPGAGGVSTISNVSNISANDEPSLGVYDSWNRDVYFSDNGVTVGTGAVNGTTEIRFDTVTAGTSYHEPRALAADPLTGIVYVVYLTRTSGAGVVGSAVAAISQRTLVNTGSISNVTGSATVYAGTKPYVPDYSSDIAFDPADGLMYVADAGADEVSVINLSAPVVLQVVHVGGFPYAVAYDPADQDIYVTNAVSDNVSVLHGTTLVGSVRVGDEPIAAAFDGSDGDVVVANLNSSNVSILNGTSLVGTLSVGGNPVFALFDPVNGYTYVVNQGSDSVSILGPSPSSSSPPAGVPPWGWGLIAVVVALLILAAVLLSRRRRRKGVPAAPRLPAESTPAPGGTPPPNPPAPPPG